MATYGWYLICNFRDDNVIVQFKKKKKEKKKKERGWNLALNLNSEHMIVLFLFIIQQAFPQRDIRNKCLFLRKTLK